MISLTAKQQELLTYIQNYLEENKNVAPTFEEMKDALNLASKSGVHRLLTGLEQRGLIRRLPNRARAMEVVGENETGLARYSIYELQKELEKRLV